MWGYAFLIFGLIIVSYFLYENIKQNRELEKSLEKIIEKYRPIEDVQEELRKSNKELEIELNKIDKLRQDYSEKYKLYKDLQLKIDMFLDDEKLVDSALYKPVYNYQTSQMYKQKLDLNYEEQKQAIKNDEAVECDTDWIVQGSKSVGQKMIQKEKTLLLKAFNSQCDREIEKAKWNNVSLIEKRIIKLFADLNKMGELHDIHISDEFLELKKQQLYINYEYEQKKYEEREEQARLREQMREEEKVRKELEQKQKELEEEEKRKVELQKLLEEAYNSGKQEEAEQHKQELDKLNEIIENNKRSISNAQLTKHGHIYIISNIGSFGDDVYKIGMTRRDKPEERVDELGDASVPFRFDIHALIESDNAPELENKLHEIFKNKSVNRVNYRKEFFRVSLEEIEEAVRKEKGSDIIFTKIAEAREYRETQAIIASENKVETSIIKENKEDDLIPQEI